MALIQERWINGGKIMGLGGIGSLPLINFGYRNLTEVKIKMVSNEGPKEGGRNITKTLFVMILFFIILKTI